MILTACSHKDEAAQAAAPPVDTVQVLATRMAECSRLYTAEYQLRKVVIYDDPAALKGKLFSQDINISLPLGKRRIAIPVTATAKAYVDMGKLTAADVHRRGDKIEIVLPDPEVTLTATQIDHGGVRQKVGLLRSSFSDEEITHVQQQGRKDIIKSLSQMDIIEDARANAARQLVPIVRQMGFREADITITFRRGLTGSSIPSLIRDVNN